MMIKAVIVDDSPTAREALRLALESDSQIAVVGEAERGSQALRLIRRLDPDIVTMDVYLHNENGLDVVAAIMERCPRPVVVITGANLENSELGFAATAAGALEVVSKLPSPTSPGYESQRYRLLRLIKTLYAVPVVHHYHSRHRRFRPIKSSTPPPCHVSKRPPRALLIGASTGGPPVVADLLLALPKPFPLPIAFVQHISSGFVDGFAAWLSQVTGHEVVITSEPVTVEAGKVYVACDDRHLIFRSQTTLASVNEDPIASQRPSVDALFESAARHLHNRVIAVLLTGMGSDGAQGMATLKSLGACTIAQKPSTCAVDGMPRAAIEQDAVEHVMTPEAIGEHLAQESQSLYFVRLSK